MAGMGRPRSAVPTKYMQTILLKGEEVRRQRGHGTPALGWRIRVWDARAGAQTESSFYGSYEQAVREMGRQGEEQARAEAPPVPHAKAITVGEWAAHWLDSVYVWKIPPAGGFDGVRRPYATWAKARSILRANLVPALGEHAKLGRITRATLVEAIGSLTRLDRAGRPTTTPLAASSKTTVVAVARSFFRDAERAGILTSNPAAHLPTVWGEPGTSRTLLVPSILDVEKLAAAMDTTWPLPTWCADLVGPNGEGHGDFVRLIAYTGLRFEELAALPASAAHLSRRTLDVLDTASEAGGRREYRTGEGKTAAATRHVTIVDQAVPVLRRLNEIRKRGLALESGRDAGRLARDPKRKPNRPLDERWLLLVCGGQGGFLGYGHWRRKLAAAQAASGVPYRAHDLRHVCASILIATPGVTKDEIRVQMGHDSISTTERVYRHQFRVDRSEMARRISAGISTMEAAENATAELGEDADW